MDDDQPYDPAAERERLLKERRREAMWKSARNATVSGAVTGASVGGISHLLAGARNPGKILAAALSGGALAGGMAGGATVVGNSLMGPPEHDDQSGYTRRGTIGGLVGGGLTGAVAGGLIGAGKLKIPKLTGLSDNLITDYLAKLAHAPSKKSIALGALVGGGVLGAGSAYRGGEEGMQMDLIHNEVAKAKKKRAQRQYDGIPE
ncbi:MAG TPA: hypothetical protein DD732_02940 [Rhizobiales bacterium]|jgi:hypothetical protein|nr:hypothetical protein [Hyphomicrobiales bacterium]